MFIQAGTFTQHNVTGIKKVSFIIFPYSQTNACADSCIHGPMYVSVCVTCMCAYQYMERGGGSESVDNA